MAAKKKARAPGKIRSSGAYSRARAERARKRRGGFFQRALFAAAAVAALGIVIMLLVFRSNNGISVFENAVGTIARPVASGFSGAAEWIKNSLANWRKYDALQAQYDQLEQENQQITLQMSGMEELEQENARLTKLLDAKQTYQSLDPVFAKIIARDPGQWFDTFTIDRGTNDRIMKGMAIVADGGLVGYVYEAGLTYAKVMAIIDARSAVACLVQRTRDNGVMRGQVTGDSPAAECHVYYLPNVNNIVPGDIVVTSGTDSLYPKGLAIGEVTAVSQETSSEGSYVIVAPYVDFRHLEEVLVLRTVVQSDAGLPVVPTPTPAPYATASPTPAATNPDGSTLAPGATGIWTYPTATPQFGATPSPTTAPQPTPQPTLIVPLPEDAWATH